MKFTFSFFVICQLRHAHMRKDTRLSLLFHIASDEKLGGAWGWGTSKWRRVTGLLHLHSAAERQGVYFGKGI